MEAIHGECIPGEKIRDLGQSVDLVKGTEWTHPGDGGINSEESGFWKLVTEVFQLFFTFIILGLITEFTKWR